MVEYHGCAKRHRSFDLRRPAIAARFINESCLIKQLVALKHFLFVPGRAFKPERDTGARPPQGSIGE